MPPWPASDVGVPLNHSKQLDPKTLAAIVKWSKAGGPLDVPRRRKINATQGPAGHAAAPRRRDEDAAGVHRVARQPERLPVLRARPAHHEADVHDRLRGDPGQPRPRSTTCRSSTSTSPRSRRAANISGKDGKPGWSCYTGPSLPSRGRDRTAIPPEHPAPARHRRGFTGQPGLIAGWVPGQDPVIYSEHSGILMQPGDALVFQVHYHYNTTPTPDRSTVAIQLDPGTRADQEARDHQPDRPGRDPVHARRRPAPLCDRNAALDGRRPPLRAGRLVHRARAARPVRQDRGRARGHVQGRRRALEL